jgi:thioredoxin-related protein
MKHLAFAAATIFLLVHLSPAEIKFLHGSLNEALTRAQAEKKPVMIDFMTDWCRWCDTLDLRTYTDASVEEFINARVIPIKIDAEKGEGIALDKKYAIQAYPTILLINADGDEIDRIVGYYPAKEFLKSMRDFVDGVNTLGQLKADIAKNPNDPSTQYAMASKYVARNDIEPAVEHFGKLLKLDPGNKLGHNEEAEFVIASHAASTGEGTSKLDTFVTHHPSSPMLRVALARAIDASLKAGDADGAKRHFLAYMEKWPKDASIMNNYAWDCAGKKLNLEQAAEVSKNAVELARSDDERAMYLDTEATVEYTRGDVNRAISLEEEALGLLKSATPKERKTYEDTLAKFKAGE